VQRLLVQQAGYSLQLAGIAVTTVLLVSLPAGMLIAAFTREGRHKAAEITFMTGTSFLGALPEYLTATLLAFILAVQLRLLPIAGFESWQTLVLPVLAITL